MLYCSTPRRSPIRDYACTRVRRPIPCQASSPGRVKEESLVKLQRVAASVGVTLILAACGEGGGGSSADQNVCSKLQDFFDLQTGDSATALVSAANAADNRSLGSAAEAIGQEGVTFSQNGTHSLTPDGARTVGRTVQAACANLGRTLHRPPSTQGLSSARFRLRYTQSLPD